MRKLLFILLIIATVPVVTNAQSYTNAIGLRGGFGGGLTYKHFIKKTVALEGILVTKSNGFDISGLYEIHAEAFDQQGLNWYYGFGGHIGNWRTNDYNDNINYTFIGIDGILGLEYNFREIPINISIDWKPSLNIVGYFGPWNEGGAISLRYRF